MCVSFRCVTARNQGWILSHGETDNSKRYKHSQKAECFQLRTHNLAAAPSYINSEIKVKSLQPMRRNVSSPGLWMEKERRGAVLDAAIRKVTDMLVLFSTHS